MLEAPYHPLYRQHDRGIKLCADYRSKAYTEAMDVWDESWKLLYKFVHYISKPIIKIKYHPAGKCK